MWPCGQSRLGNQTRFRETPLIDDAQLKAIEDLKTKEANGEELEMTQKKKIGTEQSVRDEIVSLGGTA